MVEHGDAEQAPHFDHAAGELDVGLARIWICCRMIVGDDHRMCPTPYSLPKQLSRMHVHIGKTSDGNAEHVDDALACVEQYRGEVFLFLATDHVTQKLWNVFGTS